MRRRMPEKRRSYSLPRTRRGVKILLRWVRQHRRGGGERTSGGEALATSPDMLHTRGGRVKSGLGLPPTAQLTTTTWTAAVPSSPGTQGRQTAAQV